MNNTPFSVAALERPHPNSSHDEDVDFQSYFRVESFSSGTVIYRPGDAAERIYLLRSGRVRLVRQGSGPQGRDEESVHALLRAGDLFGEILRPAGTTMEEFAIANGDVEAWSIAGRDLRALVEARPPLALEVMRGLGERTRALRQRVNALTFKDVPARLAETLATLGETHGERCAHGGQIDLRGITQQDLADLVGASRSFVSTLINEMKRDGVLGNVGRTLCIHKPEELRRLGAQDRINADEGGRTAIPNGQDAASA